MHTQTITHGLKNAHTLSPDTLLYMDHNMDKLQMACFFSALSHKRAEETVHNAQQKPSLHLTREPRRPVRP